MTSYHSEILSGDRFWVDLFKKTIVVEIRQSSCLLNFGTDALLFDFNLEKKHQAKRKSMNQTLFSTKSITLNPMVQSDLVTYMGVTLLILFLKATIINMHTHTFRNNVLSRKKPFDFNVIEFKERCFHFLFKYVEKSNLIIDI